MSISKSSNTLCLGVHFTMKCTVTFINKSFVHISIYSQKKCKCVSSSEILVWYVIPSHWSNELEKTRSAFPSEESQHQAQQWVWSGYRRLEQHKLLDLTAVLHAGLASHNRGQLHRGVYSSYRSLFYSNSHKERYWEQNDVFRSRV